MFQTNQTTWFIVHRNDVSISIFDLVILLIYTHIIIFKLSVRYSET